MAGATLLLSKSLDAHTLKYLSELRGDEGCHLCCASVSNDLFELTSRKVTTVNDSEHRSRVVVADIPKSASQRQHSCVTRSLNRSSAVLPPVFLDNGGKGYAFKYWITIVVYIYIKSCFSSIR